MFKKVSDSERKKVLGKLRREAIATKCASPCACDCKCCYTDCSRC